MAVLNNNEVAESMLLKFAMEFVPRDSISMFSFFYISNCGCFELLPTAIGFAVLNC